jgi:hypothetical protein
MGVTSMPSYLFKLEMTDEDKDRLAQLAQVTQETAIKERDARIIAERGRTIDQIKRLYAVVMGYALTACVANAYLCERALQQASWEARSIIIAPVICFVSLMALFYLGAERLLDRKYLRHDSHRASKTGLLADLMTLALSAGWFVVVANIFQAPVSPNKLDIAALRKFQEDFINGLLVLYLLDVLLLAVQVCILLRTKPEDWKNLRKAHLIWMAVNICAFCALWFGVSTIADGPLPYANIGTVSFCLVLLHAARFIVDYAWTFEFYYPSDKLAVHG